VKPWRVSYGNGQVWSCETREQAQREIDAAVERNDAYVGAMRIQRYVGDGEWETIPRRDKYTH
jgi:hypothetical protein